MLKPHEAPRRRDTVTLEFLKDTQQIKPFLWVWLEKHIKEKTREIHMPSLEVYCFSLPAFNSPKDHAPCTQASLAFTSFSSSQTLSQLGRAATQRPLSTHFQRSSAHPFFDTRTRPFYDHLSFPLQNCTQAHPGRHTTTWHSSGCERRNQCHCGNCAEANLKIDAKNTRWICILINGGKKNGGLRQLIC